MKFALFIVFLFAGLGTISSQNIFDDETVEKPKAEITTTDDGEEKPVVKVKKKKKPKKKKKAVKESAPARAGYTPEELAKSSYVWAPETEPLSLATTAPGIKPREAIKPIAVAVKAEAPEPRPADQKFRLPQIPIAQVLIVAAFVILFLIYRFRVGKQIKRKKY